MSFKVIKIKQTYDSEEDDLLNDFYIPVLSHSKAYWRLTGFFSSTSLAVAARGIKGLLTNDGYMRIVSGAYLKKEDLAAIKEGSEEPDKVIERVCIRTLENLETKFVKDHVSALAWLVANQKLEIKIAVVVDDDGDPMDWENVEASGIFHQKVGIFTDEEGNMISFSGSNNETAKGWSENIEEFKVFRSWVETEKDLFMSDLKKFQKFWEGKTKRIKIYPASRGIKEAIIKYAPVNIEKLELDYPEKEKENREVQLRDYQIEAVECWLKNGCVGIFEMATGTGKTYVGLGCVAEVIEKNKNIAIIIACPFNHLVTQWEEALEKFGVDGKKIFAFENFKSWYPSLWDAITNLNNGIIERLIIFTLFPTAMSEEFTELVKKIKKDIMFIADEVHWLGAEEFQKALLPAYKYRIGLSATPKRWLDPVGSKIIEEYFQKVVYEFPLKRAIREGYLVPYEYHIVIVPLTEEEMEEYISKTKRILRLSHQAEKDEEIEKKLDQILNARQDIVRGASKKIEELEKLLANFHDISHTLIYCNDHKQMEKVHSIISRKVIYAQFTGEEPMEVRKKILDMFEKGEYQVITAIKCLDEGVDVPPTKIAIILASSGNPKQYIQRRGRVLRRYPNKNKAIIYDFLVVPDLDMVVDEDLVKIERRIFKRELRRYDEFARESLNYGTSLQRIRPYLEKFGVYYGGE